MKAWVWSRHLRLGLSMVAAIVASAVAPSAVAAADLPGIDTGAVSGQPCGNRMTFAFGRDVNGNLMGCHWDQPAGTFLWDGPLSGPLMGLQDVGAPCTGPSGRTSYAQAPDGYPLSCSPPGSWGRI